MAYNSVLECAISQIGEHNDSDGSNKYNEWYWGYRAKAAWCAVFMTWCFKQVGIISRLDGLTNKAGCEPWRRWAVANGIWSKTPKVGAIVLYDWNPKTGDGADHIGIVEKVLSDGIVAIEGNTSARGSQTNGGYVLRKERPNSLIMGYVYVDTFRIEPMRPVYRYGEGVTGAQVPVFSYPDKDHMTPFTLRERTTVYCYGSHNTDGCEYWRIDNLRDEWARKTSLKERKTYKKAGYMTYGFGFVSSKTGVRIHSAPNMESSTSEVIGVGTKFFCYSTHKEDGFQWWSLNPERTKWCRETSLKDREMVKEWREI